MYQPYLITFEYINVIMQASDALEWRQWNVLPDRALGGQVFNADSHKPSRAHPKVFAVCPISLTAEEEQSLWQSDASFQQVHPSCKVTLFWINICEKVRLLCIQSHELLLLEWRGHLTVAEYTQSMCAT